MTLTAKRVRDILLYDPGTGLFRWRIDRRGGKKAGDVAGCFSSSGYIVIGIDSKLYQSHRIAWLYTHGEFPPQSIDHINGIKTDNRLINLRAVSHSENMQNQRIPRRSNKSGLLGVVKFHRKWRAVIYIYGERHYLGLFASKELAHAAYLEAQQGVLNV